MLTRLDLRGAADLARALARSDDDADDGDEALAAVREILAAVRRGGDAAVRELTRRFDGCDLADPRVPAADLQAALDAAIPGDLRTALEIAAARIREYHALQADVVEPVLDRDGVSLREVVVPVGRAGLYVPGGRAAYPSTVLMTAIPAQLAGVDELVLCVPPAADGRVPDATLAAAALRRDHRGRTDRRCPGDRRVGVRHRVHPAGRRDRRARATATSRWPSARSRAGSASSRSPVRPRWWWSPTGPCPPTFAAADLLAQAEHGPGGAAVLVAWDAAVDRRHRGRDRPSPRRRAPRATTSVRPCAAGDGRSWSTTRSPRSTR